MIPKRPALDALTSLRFFAALAIVIHHCNGVFWRAANLGPLDAGVSFFFVLSGFILTYVYYAPSAEQFSWQDFYIARLARIWPLHLLCLLLTIVLVNLPEPFDPTVLLANGLMLHAWMPFDRYFFSYNYPSWSISTELFFYLMFPLMLRCSQALRYTLLALSLASVLALAVIGAALHLPVWDTAGDHLSSTGLLYTNPLARCGEFLLGVIGGIYFLRGRSEVVASTVRWTLVEILAIVFFGVAFRFFLLRDAQVPNLFGSTDKQSVSLLSEWFSHVALAPFAAVLIFVFAYQRGVASQLLTHRGFVLLGEISFALYLVHQLTLRALQQHGVRPDIVGFGGYLIAIIVLATLLHFGFEQPVRRWLTRRNSVRRQS